MSSLYPFLPVAKTSIVIDVTGYLDRHYQPDARVNFQNTVPIFRQAKQESRAESRRQHLNDDTIQKQVHQRNEHARRWR